MLDLVKSRKVFLKAGIAYVPENDVIVAVASKFRENLSHSLTVSVILLCGCKL